MTEGEDLIKPSLRIVGQHLGEKATKFIDGLALSDNTIMRRVEDMATDVSEQLVEKQNTIKFFSLALDGSTDATDTPQLGIFGRFVDEDLNISEELLGVVGMEGKTRGIDIFEAVNKCAVDMKLDWTKLESVY
jgi:hypothetical protein